MGIKDLFKITKDGKPISDFGQNVKLKDLGGYRIAIDGNLIAYMAAAAISADKSLLDSEGRITSHLRITLNKILELNKNNISQVWVFDSPIKNERKAETHEKRKANPRRFIMTSEYLEEIKYVLGLMGITYIIAPPGIEAEQYGAWLTEGPIVEERYCQYLLTKDSDTLLFGGNMLRFYKEKKVTKYQLYDYIELMNDLEITQEQFETIATVMGHDFYPSGVKGTGIKRVYQKVKEGKIVMNDEQVAALEQFRLDPNEYLEEAEFHENKYDRETAETWFAARGFNTNTLKKQLDKYNYEG